jgi:uncharacterized phage infection (PIP) family protein YhgE
MDKTMSALTDAADAMKAVVAEAITAISDEAAQIKNAATQISDLNAQLAAALAAGNNAEASAVAAQLQQATSDLHAAIDAAHAPSP